MHIKFAKIRKFAYADEERKLKDFKRLKRDSPDVKSVKGSWKTCRFVDY